MRRSHPARDTVTGRGSLSPMGAIDDVGGGPEHGLEPGAFATRLANLLRHERERAGLRTGTMARRSGGRFSAAELRRFEAGEGDLQRAAEVAELYGADLESILPERLPLEVDPGGTIATAGVSEPFGPDDDTSLLLAYLRLVRRLRNEQRAELIVLRRADVETLAGVLALPGETVTDRLGALMGATRVQRRVMVGMFVAGAAVIGLTVGTVAATSDPAGDTGVDVLAAVPEQVVEDGATDDTTDDTTDVAADDTTDDAAVTTVAAPPTTVAAGRFLSDRGLTPSLTLSSPVLSPGSDAPGDDVAVDTTVAAPATTAAPPPPPAATAPPAPTTTEPDVIVAPPPVPTTTVPIPEPVPTTEPEIVVGPPPVPTTSVPIPDPVAPDSSVEG